MDTRACATVLIVLVGILLARAGSVVAGGIKATFAAGVGARDAAALRRLISARLEDAVAPELSVDVELHRRVLAGAIRPDVSNPHHPACIGPCPAPGRPYVPIRGCEDIYQCPHLNE
ncbi:hypothetical protein HU200_056599 [Digitaria exilis]|uniref:Uncharacterized protein n=1 Tax=Digitaria exilis TaxID=1010633 RepID=A0A835AR69_9POAL|nr:hypothetical protein HU200_056599 [Digitaria exilis]